MNAPILTVLDRLLDRSVLDPKDLLRLRPARSDDLAEVVGLLNGTRFALGNVGRFRCNGKYTLGELLLAEGSLGDDEPVADGLGDGKSEDVSLGDWMAKVKKLIVSHRKQTKTKTGWGSVRSRTSMQSPPPPPGRSDSLSLPSMTSQKIPTEVLRFSTLSTSCRMGPKTRGGF